MTAELGEQLHGLLKLFEPLGFNRALQAYVSYQAGDDAPALAYWEKAAATDDARGVEALRNLAVHHHRRAYELEVQRRGAEALAFWEKALPLWARLFGMKSFEAMLPVFSQVQSGLALGPEESAAMLGLLHEAVLAPHVALAAEAVERKEWELAARHAALARDVDLREPVVSAALEQLAQRVCRISHDEVEHTSLEEATAQVLLERAEWAVAHLPRQVHGALALGVVVTWRALKAAQTGEGVAGALARLQTLVRGPVLTRLEQARDTHDDPLVAHLARRRGERLAEVAAELHMAAVGLLFRRRGALIDRVNAVLEAPHLGGAARVRNAVDDGLRETEALAQEARQIETAGVPLCTELARRFGGKDGVAQLRELLSELLKRCSSDLATLRDIRKRIS